MAARPVFTSGHRRRVDAVLAGASRRARHRHCRSPMRSHADAVAGRDCHDHRALPIASLPARAPIFVTALPPSSPSLCSTLHPSVVSAPSVAQSPRRLHRAGFSGGDSPSILLHRDPALTARRPLRFSHATQRAVGPDSRRLCYPWCTLETPGTLISPLGKRAPIRYLAVFFSNTSR